ncbi:hypothetical protein EDD21DRAFT_385938 [Dissophora ornata]|nr:hypothetical protein BGZ58_001961 [Dissophora ornata]KAI8597237.1 hypothetical protein EDD21DRAFT_385938 [Dissophora ornata]
MSRTPSIYSDALDTPLQDPTGDTLDTTLNSDRSSSHPGSYPTAEHQSDMEAEPIQQDVQVEDTNDHGGHADGDDQQLRSARPHSGIDMDVDEDHHHDEDASMQVDPASGTSHQGDSATALPPSSSSSSSQLTSQQTQSASGGSRRHSQAGSSSRTAGGGWWPLTQVPSSPSSGLGSGSGAAASTSRSVSVPVVDEKAQSELRRKIMDIQRDPAISFAEKASMIQRLMSSKWQGSQRSSDSHNDGSVEATADDLKKTYYNEDQGQLGCKHYMRGCKLKANCCGKWFNCRFCHDDASDHAIVRSETKMMMCMHCQTIQPAAQNCSSCEKCLAVYYCDICKLWDDDSKKNIYHCDDCGICRIGQGLGQDYFHCKRCNVCMNIRLQGNHKCIERNLECDCPICGEYMFTSTTTVIFMPCGHCIHSTCHEDYIKTSYQCPTCWKSLGDMSGYYSKIDSLLAEQTMPPEYVNIFSIVLCNDCEVKSEAPYHFLYHKCDKCKGYNTKVLETFKRVTDGQVQVVENATAAGAAAAVPENNISGSSSGLAGSSSAAGGSGGASSSSAAGSSSLGGPGTTSVNIANVGLPRSPLMDENASGDMSMGSISNNSAP